MKKPKSIILIILLLVGCQNTQTSNSSTTTDISSSFDSTISLSGPSSTSFSSSSSVCYHFYDEEIIQEPTLLESGLKKFTCQYCGITKEEAIYKLDEFVFEDETFMYDGNEHDLVIKGLLPLGTVVEYENNTLKEIGTKEVTANIYDSFHKLLTSKKAMLSIVENTGFPNIYIDTSNVEILDKENYVDMTLSIDNCAKKYEINNVPGGIRLRGNGTLTYDKKAYRLKLSGKSNLLGLNDGLKAKSWVLIADYADQSMMRNETAFYIGNSLLNYSKNYCSDYKHVNLYLNNSYNGVYLLAEQQQVNKSRININEPETDYIETDIGYLLELDNYAKQEEYYFEIGNSWGDQINGVNLPKKAYSIKSDCYDKSQVNFIKKYLGNLYTAFMRMVKGEGLYVLDENNELIESPYDNQYDTLNAMIDLDSVFRMYLLHELMKNCDVGFSSFYMFVDFSETSLYKRLTFGAPWDFDWSSGNVNESPYTTSKGEFNSTNFNHMNPWFYMLSKTDFFKLMIQKYYLLFTESHLLDYAIANANYEADAFADEFARNYEKWQTLGTIIPKYTPNDVKSFKVHKDAVNHFVNWLKNREKSLNSIFLPKDETPIVNE